MTPVPILVSQVPTENRRLLKGRELEGCLFTKGLRGVGTHEGWCRSPGTVVGNCHPWEKFSEQCRRTGQPELQGIELADLPLHSLRVPLTQAGVAVVGLRLRGVLPWSTQLNLVGAWSREQGEGGGGAAGPRELSAPCGTLGSSSLGASLRVWSQPLHLSAVYLQTPVSPSRHQGRAGVSMVTCASVSRPPPAP